MKKFLPLSGLLVFAALLPGCADLFQEKVALNRGSSDLGSLQDLLQPVSTEPIVLAAPTQLYVADAQSPSVIRLGWNAVAGASSYSVERAVLEPLSEDVFPPEPAEGDFEVLEAFVYATSYTDSIIPEPGQNPSEARPEYRNRYYYRVRAENVRNGLDPSSPSAVGMGTLFAFPRNVRAGKGVSGAEIRVDWDRVKGAASYRVYRSEYASGAAPLAVARVFGNQNWYRDAGIEKNRDYYYSVEALTPLQVPSAAGPLALGYAIAENAPGKLSVRLAAGFGRGHHTDRIRVEWVPDPAPGVTYAVYRYSSADSSLTPLARGETAAFWEDTAGLEPGIFYYYQVQPSGTGSGGTALKGPFSDPVEAFILSPPVTVLAEKSGTLVSLKWFPVIGTPAEQAAWSYRVYGSNNSAGPFHELRTVSAPVPVGSDGYVHADGVGDYSVYRFYRVSTFNSLSVESVPGATVSPHPAAALIQHVSRGAFLAGEAPNGSGVYPVRIGWKKPADEEPAFYHLYRSAEPDSGFRRITTNPIPGGSGGEFSFIDQNRAARVGRWYYYRLLSLNELGQGSAWSDTLAGYGALSYEQYMLEYNKTVLSSQKKLTLMHKPNNMDKLGSEIKYGTISGSISYDARIENPGARIIMRYENYADFFIGGDSSRGVYFAVTGNTNTTTSISGNGKMDGTMECTGMYPGKVYYDNVEIKGGAAGGGTYGIEPEGFPRGEVNWLVGEKR
ncbi:MAG: hypothetical protein LBD78_09290 [Spirochaetaceae bacterium]|jgi:fibronectin type 3 domain-containing protein|nr:hypothetical protein [Spirochaetaceae bacterium]